MPRIFNLGSINLDCTIRVPYFPTPGETISGAMAGTSLGGKGLNISVALKRAGLEPVHIGAIGADDTDVLRELASYEIDTTHIARSTEASGRAFVLLDETRENSIIVCPGANRKLSADHIEQALSPAEPGDWLTLQNETNGHGEAIRKALSKGMRIAYMAAPFDAKTVCELIAHIDLLALNETEAAQLERFIGKSIEDLGLPRVLVTQGSRGARYVEAGRRYAVSGLAVPVRDTTAAGDTFFGYFLAEYLRTGCADASLSCANAAAALAVQKDGAARSIPRADEVRAFMGELA